MLNRAKQLKNLFASVEHMERDCWNALKYYRHLEDNLADLHYKLDKLITMEEANEGSKSSRSGGSGTEVGTPDRNGYGTNDQSNSCDESGSDGAYTLVEQGSLGTNLTNLSPIPCPDGITGCDVLHLGPQRSDELRIKGS